VILVAEKLGKPGAAPPVKLAGHAALTGPPVWARISAALAVESTTPLQFACMGCCRRQASRWALCACLGPRGTRRRTPVGARSRHGPAAARPEAAGGVWHRGRQLRPDAGAAHRAHPRLRCAHHPVGYKGASPAAGRRKQPRCTGSCLRAAAEACMRVSATPTGGRSRRPPRRAHDVKVAQRPLRRSRAQGGLKVHAGKSPGRLTTPLRSALCAAAVQDGAGVHAATPPGRKATPSPAPSALPCTGQRGSACGHAAARAPGAERVARRAGDARGHRGRQGPAEGGRARGRGRRQRGPGRGHRGARPPAGWGRLPHISGARRCHQAPACSRPCSAGGATRCHPTPCRTGPVRAAAGRRAGDTCCEDAPIRRSSLVAAGRVCGLADSPRPRTP